MGLAKKQTNAHASLAQILGIIIVACLVFAIVAKLVHKKILPLQKQQTMQMTPTITPHEEKIATLTNIDTKTKRVSFPKYNVAFEIPNDYKLGYEVSGYDKPTPDSIVIDTPDLIIRDQGPGVEERGAQININILSNVTGFTAIKTLESHSYMQIPIKVVTDTSAIPIDNPLVSQNNTQILSYPQFGDITNVWVYLAEVHTEISEQRLKKSIEDPYGFQHITIKCMDYADTTGLTPSMRCHDIVKNLLGSLRIQ